MDKITKHAAVVIYTYDNFKFLQITADLHACTQGEEMSFSVPDHVHIDINTLSPIKPKMELLRGTSDGEVKTEAESQEIQEEVKRHSHLNDSGSGETAPSDFIIGEDIMLLLHDENDDAANEEVITHHDKQQDNEMYPKNFEDFFPASFTKEGCMVCLNRISQQRKCCCGNKVNLLLKINLLVFYLIYFILQTVVFAIENEYPVHNTVSCITSFTGLLYESCVIAVPYLYQIIKRKYCKQSQSENDKEMSMMTHENEKNVSSNSEVTETTSITNDESMPHDFEVTETASITVNKRDPYNSRNLKYIIAREFLIDLPGELLLYPSIICSLYGFLNERSWDSGNTAAIIYFVMLIYSGVMDAIYTKFTYMVFLARIIHKITKEVRNLYERKKRDRIDSSYLLGFFALLLMLTHWLMLAVTGVRIYVDNITTGSYESSAFTSYMIFCGLYLPIVSIVVHFLLNRNQYLQIFWLVKNRFYTFPNSLNLFACLKDWFSYVAVAFLIVPFIPFAVGSFLPDNNNSEPVPRDTARGLGVCVIIFFLLSNFQAAILFTLLIFIVPIRLVTQVRSWLTTANSLDKIPKNDLTTEY